MEVLKTAIFTACIIGIVSSFTDIAAPSGSLRNQLKIILTMILILGMFTPFLGSGFKFDLDGIEELIQREEYENLTEDFQNMYLNQSSENIESVITDLIKKQGIDIEQLVIDSQLNEYNSLEIKKVTVYLNEPTQSQKDTIISIINENLPGSEVEFAEEDNSEY